MPMPEMPELLKEEFRTVQAVWRTSANTRMLDTFILTWVKYEKQARRLLTSLVFQVIGEDATELTAARRAIERNRYLYPPSCLRGVAQFADTTLDALIGEQHAPLEQRITRIQRRYRNKLLHGQLTGEQLNETQLHEHTLDVIAWMSALAEIGMAHFGCHGFERGSERFACRQDLRMANRPFSNAAEFEHWLTQLTARHRTP